MKRILILAITLISTLVSAQKKNIQPSQLPEGALDFIEQNFTSVALHHCMKFTDGDHVHFKAVLADDTEIDLTDKGEWTAIDGKVHSIQPTFLGPAIIAQIKKSQPGQRLLKATKTSKTIEVTLVNGTTLTFDKAGNLLK